MKSKRKLAVVILPVLSLLSLLVFTSCGPKAKSFGIIFTSDNGDPGAMDIYQISDDTQSQIEQLTYTPTFRKYPLLVSEDGSEIIFESGFKEVEGEFSLEQHHIYLLDITSKEIMDITRDLVDYEQVWQNFSLDWSEVENQFVMVTNEVKGSKTNSYLEFVGFDGTRKNEIYIPTIGEIPAVIETVKWSPNGKNILLTQSAVGLGQQLQNLGSAILVYDLENSNLTQFTDYQDHCLPNSWSPAGQEFVATCFSVVPSSIEGISGPGTVRIFDIEKDDQTDKPITFSSCDNPSWSPNGEQLAIVCDKGYDQKGLFVVNSIDNGMREVKIEGGSNPVILKDPTWSPDGTQIIYVAGTDTRHERIFSVNTNGSKNRSLTDQEAGYEVVSVYPRK